MYCTYDVIKFIENHSQQNSNKTCKVIINTVKIVTTKQCIKRINQLVLVQNIGINISTISKIPIANIENFAISAADILPIRYIGTPLQLNYIDVMLLCECI